MTTNTSVAGAAGAVAVNAVSDLESLKENINFFFLMIMGALVLFLQTAFAFLEIGFVRSRNVTSLLLYNFLDTGISCICYWLLGYGLAYGEGNAFCGVRYFASAGLPQSRYGHWFFQFTFVATASTIITGSLAERCTVLTYFLYSVLLSGFVYPIISHWAWAEEGWLKTLGFVDFAGSCVVHLTGGSAALFGSFIVGPRSQRFTSSRNLNLKPHSVPFIVLGYFVLLFGILAFNGGSQGSITNPGDGIIAIRAVINTLVCSSVAAITALFFNRFFLQRNNKSWSVLVAINGCITGMVSVCAGADQYETWAAAIVGFFAPFVYFALQKILIKFKIDDPVDAAPIHLGGGLWGTVAVCLFGSENGTFIKGNRLTAVGLLVNLLGILCIFLWVGLFIGFLFSVLKHFKKDRVSPELEDTGLDQAVTREPAYSFSVRDFNEQLQLTLDYNKKMAPDGYSPWIQNFW